MMDQQILKIIKAVAAQLPVVMQQTSEEHHVDGAELIEQGHYEEGKEKIQPGIKYKQHMPVLIARNHERRLRHEYEKHGHQGILNYVEKIKQLALANAN